MKWISQGFLEDDIVRFRCGYFDLKFLLQLWIALFVDYTMTNTQNIRFTAAAGIGDSGAPIRLPHVRLGPAS